MNKSNGNNAYKYDYYYKSMSERRYDYNGSEFERYRYNSEYIKKAEREKARNAAMKKAQKIEKIILVALSVAAVFFASVVLVYRYVLITELNLEANNLKSQYSALVSENESIQNKIDSAVDLKKLQEIATSRLGMVKPQADQIIHIENSNESYGEKVEKKEKEVTENNSEDAAISGVPGSIVRYATGK